MSEQAQTPADLLAEVFDAARTGRRIDADAARWLAKGIASAVRRGEALDSALGLSAPGQRSLQRQLLTLVRNVHLLQALRLVSVDDELGDWPRCERLAPLVRGFVAETWPRAKRLDAPPPDWPGWRVELFRAARTDLELPCSAGGLFFMAQQAARCLPSARRAMLLASLLDIEPSSTSINTPSLTPHEHLADLRRHRPQCDL